MQAMPPVATEVHEEPVSTESAEQTSSALT